MAKKPSKSQGPPGKHKPPGDKLDLPLAPPVSPPPSGNQPASDNPEADPLARWRAAREMEEEMSEMFDEDRVTHQHGATEPEAD